MRGRPRAAAADSATTRYPGADGRWHARVTVGWRLDGERDRRHVSRATKRELEAAIRDLENARDSGQQPWLLDNVLALMSGRLPRTFDSWAGGSNHRQMTMTANGATGARAERVEPLDAAACLFHGFSDPSRIAILRQLAHGEFRVTDLTAHIGLAQSTVSKHLACLRDCGLVTSRPEGRASMFSLTHPEALDALFASAERLLELTGDAVALCANYGTDTLPRNDR